MCSPRCVREEVGPHFGLADPQIATEVDLEGGINPLASSASQISGSGGFSMLHPMAQAITRNGSIALSPAKTFRDKLRGFPRRSACRYRMRRSNQ
jgi:hypothetical protein